MKQRIIERTWSSEKGAIRSTVTLVCEHEIEMVDAPTGDPNQPIRYAWDGATVREDGFEEIECPKCPA